MTDLVQRQVLRALFCLSRDTRPISALTIADASGLTPTRAAEALVALERGGWVDASRARLTLRGLALATRIKGGAGGLGQKPRAAAAVAAQPAIAAPWAAAEAPADSPPSVATVAIASLVGPGATVAIATSVGPGAMAATCEPSRPAPRDEQPSFAAP